MKSTGLILGTLLLAASLTACGRSEIEFDACGEVNATEITVSAQAAGELMELDIEEGSKVTKGQMLGYVDSIQTYLKLQELISRAEGAKTKTIDIDCQLSAQYAKLEKLQKDLIRYKGLLESEAGTQKQVDDTESEIAMLSAEISAARQSYSQNNEGTENEIGTLNIQIAQSEDQLDKCRIISPIDGTVLTKYAEAGEVVSVGKSIFKVADLDHVYVRAYFTSDQLRGIRLGDTVTVIPDDGSDSPRQYKGRISWIADEAEFTPKNIQTRNERADLVYAVKVSLKNDGNLRLGMYAYIRCDERH